jgi:hypothetical protein
VTRRARFDTHSHNIVADLEMVVVGNFSVRLVNAETKEPFKEHTGPDGKIYAEVEPDLEYFIETSVIGGDPQKVLLFTFFVDGKKLPYRSFEKEVAYKGMWSIQDGISTTTALTFTRPSFSDSKSSTSPGLLMGDVKVDISEGIYSGIRTLENFDSGSLQPASISASITHAHTKKVLRSGEGTISESKAAYSKGTLVNSYVPGALLGSITIHYCTALGLIHAGVLENPVDIWARARLINPCKRTSAKEDVASIRPKRVKSSALVEAPKEVDLFDLSSGQATMTRLVQKTKMNVVHLE